MPNADTRADRVQWLDHARGLSIILIVLLHSSYALEGLVADGPVAALIEMVRPFRLPALFFLSGLFLAKVIAAPTREFLDRRILHYAYFYALWATIEFGAAVAIQLSRGDVPEDLASSYGMLFVNPHGPLWFIYALPFFFLVARLLRRVPAWIVLPVAAILSMLPIETGWVITDRLASRFVYFYGGYVLAQWAFLLGREVRGHRLVAGIALVAWMGLHWLLVSQAAWAGSSPTLFLLGVMGVVGVVAGGAWLSTLPGTGWLAMTGNRSLVIFLAFPLVLIVARKVLQVIDLPIDGDTTIALMATGAIVGSLLLERIARPLRLGWLFERPRWAHIRSVPLREAKPAFKGRPAAAGDGS